MDTPEVVPQVVPVTPEKGEREKVPPLPVIERAIEEIKKEDEGKGRDTHRPPTIH